MSETILSITNAQLAYGHHPLLDRAEFAIQRGERVGLIGRNGAGKSSLLRVLNGKTLLDDGELKRIGGLRVTMVEQEPTLPPGETVFDHLCADMLQSEDWQRSARANAMIDTLGLDAQAMLADLSGGTRKRVALARAMVDQPDLLLLDEPTNHLDFDGIIWLENALNNANFAVLVITHDRRFLDHVVQRIVELDRGQLLSFPGNFSLWQERKAQWLEAEAQANARFDKLLSQEEVWIRKGIEARRTRNEGRVRRLEALRRERAARREQQGQVSFNLADGQRSGKRVAELDNVSFAYGDKCIVKNFSTLIQRADRVGFIGPNGAGKTTLLRIILGELQPDAGSVKLGTNLLIGYFDQMRNQLDENATLADTISPGSEWVEIGQQRKHVMAYLEDFLFPPARAQSPVASLSGGERARLALARLFARPHNVLVLDEPTNDLDIDTLELLESLLMDYQGTVLIVSHDRSFLDNIVTQTIAAEGDGKWCEYVGGYEEWLSQRPAAQPEAGKKPANRPAAPKKAAVTPARSIKKTRKSKLAPWEAEELEAIPDKIAQLEQHLAQQAARLSAPETYQEPELAQQIQAEVDQLGEQLEALFERWELLEQKL